jgi:hypothetical protein
MPIRRKLRAFLARSGVERQLILEAALMLALARIVVLAFPFRVLTGWIERLPDGRCSDPQLPVRVRSALGAAARNVPWKAVCLTQAIAAKAMLARRGQGAAFHLGARIDPNGKLIGHAWLVCDGVIVTGASGMAGISQLLRLG